MLKRLRGWLRSMVALRRMTVAQRMAEDWTERSHELCARLEDAAESLRMKKLLIDQVYDSASSDLEDANKALRQHETVVEALRSENKILGEVEVATLTAAHQLLLERYRAHCAVEVMRQVAASGGRIPEER